MTMYTIRIDCASLPLKPNTRKQKTTLVHNPPACPNPLALRHLGLTASQEVGGLRDAAVTRALRPRTALTVVKYHAWCGSGGFHGEPRVTKTSLGDTRYGQCHLNNVLETCLQWRGRMRMEPCQIGSIRPRHQARERRSLQTSKTKFPSG